MNKRRFCAMVQKTLFLLGVLLLMGCAASVDDPSPGQSEKPTPTEAVARLTEAPGVTATPQSTRLFASATPATIPTTSVPRASLTPAPTATLTDDEKAASLAELMETNGGCELPCWWGIVPGYTRIAIAREMLTTEGLWWENNYAGIRVKDDFGVFLEFEVEEDVIHSINVEGDYLTGGEDSPAYSQAFARGWQRYGLTEILSRHGVPSQVLVYRHFQADPGQPSYHLLIFYEQLGIEIEYTGRAEQLNGDHYRACPNLADIWDIGLFLYQSDRVENVVQRVLPPESVSFIAGPEAVYDLISWQEATGTSLESFHESFSAPEAAACFEFTTPWP